ncbi:MULTISPECIES: ATP-binding protein [Bacteroidota]|nr:MULTISPECIES: ATP-binding protein [Bacteroidota]
MDNFDFSTLNSSDLEELVCDLLNASEVQLKPFNSYRTFKEGKDRGIDILRSSEENNYESVVQVKHYLKTGISGLLRDLKKNEVEKVKKLQPNRYLIVTSVDLGVNDIHYIKEIFEPYITNLSDILGLKDLNRLVSLYPQVLQKHFKLWFSGSDVLKRILQYQYFGRSQEFLENNLKRKIRLYVKTSMYEIARESLRKDKFIIITGEPGCGKTSLAELLLYEYIGNQYELNYILNIKEVDNLIKSDDTKQIFYFDDFLGHNSLEIRKAKASENYLVQALNRIKNRRNKHFIFTTRTFILNEAVAISERLQKYHLIEKQSILHLKEYDHDLKLKMLENHIQESDLQYQYKSILYKDNIIKFIINHKNFYPRSIEFITDPEYISDITPSNFESYIYENFNSPQKIWRHAYNEQIDELDRFFLSTMISFGNNCSIQYLEEAFIARIEYEVLHNNVVKTFDPFNSSFRRLLGGFIMYEYHDKFESIKFINPSLVDFLLVTLRENSLETRRIVESTIFISQLITRLYPIPKPSIERGFIPSKLLKRLSNNCEGFIFNDDTDYFTMALFLISYANNKDCAEAINFCLNNVKDWLSLNPESDSIETLVNILYGDVCYDRNEIINIGVSIYGPLIIFVEDFESILNFQKQMKMLYDFNLKELFHLYNTYNWAEYFDQIINNRITDYIDELESIGHDPEKLDFAISRVEDYKKIVMNWGFISSPDISLFRDYEFRSENT